jgi:hypothetical protein
MDLILYCFTYTDFKIINIEACENIGIIYIYILINNQNIIFFYKINLIAEVLKEYIFLALCDDEMC